MTLILPQGASLVTNIAFQGAIGAMLSLLAVYWLGLNIMQAMKGMLIIGSMTLLTGNRALSNSDIPPIILSKQGKKNKRD